MPLQMETGVLSRRLDRLRSAPGRTATERRPRVDHAATLATDLGGAAHNGVAVFEAAFHVPVDRRALSALPYGVPPDKPLICLDLETTGLATGAGTLAF